jgi:hypothetical protein
LEEYGWETLVNETKVVPTGIKEREVIRRGKGIKPRGFGEYGEYADSRPHLKMPPTVAFIQFPSYSEFRICQMICSFAQ